MYCFYENNILNQLNKKLNAKKFAKMWAIEQCIVNSCFSQEIDQKTQKKKLESEKRYPIPNYYHSTQREEIILIEKNQEGGI